MNPFVLVVSAACIALAVAACGGGGGAESAGPVPSASVEAVSAETLTFELWFIGDDRGPCCTVYSTSRTADELGIPHVGTDFAIGPHLFETLVEALLADPSPREKALGFMTSFPSDSRLLGVSLENGIVTVDLSSVFPAGFVGLPGLFELAQVVYTVTQFPEIEGVRFKLAGRPVQVPPGTDPRLGPIPPAGVNPEAVELLDRPVTREDYESALPPVTVEAPMIGSEVSSPVRIAGTASNSEGPIEGPVNARVLDAAGTPLRDANGLLSDRYITVTCGNYCRSDYEIEIPFEVSEPRSAVIQIRTQGQWIRCNHGRLYESGEDVPREPAACRLMLPSIPVTLVP